MSKAQKNLRQELLEARAKVQRQIEIVEAGPAINVWGGELQHGPAQIAELTATLKELEDALANLGDDDA